MAAEAGGGEAPVTVGSVVEVSTERVAHGGHVVGRIATAEPDGRPLVVFVRHALPGERVRVRITETARSFARGDAVEVLVASPDRVEPPCPLAVPAGCGGCDLQHVAVPAQRAWKAAVLAEQFERLAGLTIAAEVEAVPVPGADADDGLRWRTRMQYVSAADGTRGLRRHRSHEVVAVADCLLEAPGARITLDGVPLRPGAVVTESVRGREFRVAGDGFWQVHPAAAEVLVDAVLGGLAPRAGEHALDLYAGVGLFSRFLAEAVGPGGSVLAVESDRRAADLAGENLSGQPWAQARPSRVDRALAALERDPSQPVDLVVLDPPRSGAKRAVVERIAALGPRAVAYVACDPAALARDVALFAAGGYAPVSVRGFDLFPMTHHLEAVAILEPTGDRRAGADVS